MKEERRKARFHPSSFILYPSSFSPFRPILSRFPRPERDNAHSLEKNFGRLLANAGGVVQLQWTAWVRFATDLPDQLRGVPIPRTLPAPFRQPDAGGKVSPE
jgi:hypothetical protein